MHLSRRVRGECQRSNPAALITFARTAKTALFVALNASTFELSWSRSPSENRLNREQSTFPCQSDRKDSPQVTDPLLGDEYTSAGSTLEALSRVDVVTEKNPFGGFRQWQQRKAAQPKPGVALRFDESNAHGGHAPAMCNESEIRGSDVAMKMTTFDPK